MVQVMSLRVNEIFSTDCKPEAIPLEVSPVKLRHPIAYPAWQGKQLFTSCETVSWRDEEGLAGEVGAGREKLRHANRHGKIPGFFIREENRSDGEEIASCGH